MPDQTLAHRRTIQFETFDEPDHLRVVARLRDDDVRNDRAIHDMELRATLSRDDLVITSCEVLMHAFPHAECPDVTPGFDGLVGLSVARGFTRQVQERFGGVAGCAHVQQVLRALAPAVMQAAGAIKRWQIDTDQAPPSGPSPWVRGSCHVWAEDGPAEQKIAAGWLPGTTERPAPRVDEIRARFGTPDA